MVLWSRPVEAVTASQLEAAVALLSVPVEVGRRPADPALFVRSG